MASKRRTEGTPPAKGVLCSSSTPYCSTAVPFLFHQGWRERCHPPVMLQPRLLLQLFQQVSQLASVLCLQRTDPSSPQGPASRQQGSQGACSQAQLISSAPCSRHNSSAAICLLPFQEKENNDHRDNLLLKFSFTADLQMKIVFNNINVVSPGGSLWGLLTFQVACSLSNPSCFTLIAFQPSYKNLSTLSCTSNICVFVLRTSLKKWIVPISDLSQKMNLPFSSLKQATTTKFFSHLFLILEKPNEVKFPRLLVASPFTLQFSTFCFHSSSKVHYPTSDAFCSLQMSAVRWEVKWLQQPTDPIKIEHQHAKAETASHRIPKCSFAFAPYDQLELRLCWVLSTFIKHVCILKKLSSAGCKVRF